MMIMVSAFEFVISVELKWMRVSNTILPVHFEHDFRFTIFLLHVARCVDRYIELRKEKTSTGEVKPIDSRLESIIQQKFKE